LCVAFRSRFSGGEHGECIVFLRGVFVCLGSATGGRVRAREAAAIDEVSPAAQTNDGWPSLCGCFCARQARAACEACRLQKRRRGLRFLRFRVALPRLIGALANQRAVAAFVCLRIRSIAGAGLTRCCVRVSDIMTCHSYASAHVGCIVPCGFACLLVVFQRRSCLRGLVRAVDMPCFAGVLTSAAPARRTLQERRFAK